jgi:chaperonin GroEL
VNQLPKREIKDMQFGDEARQTVVRANEKLYKAVSSTYGPSGNNVLQGMPFGDPVLTRDGVTVAKRVILEDRAENDAIAPLRQASEKTNKTAGDGTTATIVFAFNLLKAAHPIVAAGENAMVLKKQIEQDSRKVIDFLQSKSKPATDQQLLEVATVSAGDTNIGTLVADTLKDIGSQGGITIREQSYPTVDVEKINGYYFGKGCDYLNSVVEWTNPWVLVTQKAITSNADVVPLIQLIAQNPEKRHQLIIVGDVTGEAKATLIQNTARPDFPFEAIVIPPLAYGEESRLYMEDIAVYTGTTVFSEADSYKDIALSYFGSAQRVKVGQDDAIVFGDSNNGDAITDRASAIQINIDKETNAHKKDQLETRYSKLIGKIAIVNVGGSTPAEMEELRFRVEDAIEATKSAMADGVLPGGGTMLVHASMLDISPLYAKALRNTFKKLMENAAQEAGYRLKQVEKAKFGHGFNLREMTEEPIDLAKAGIWDASRAVVQTVENATSAAGALLTIDTLVTPRDEEAKA